MIMPGRVDNVSDIDPPHKVSARSLWSDPQWHLDGRRPDLRTSHLLIDWAFELPNGSRFTDLLWAGWLEDARIFLWSLRVDPPPGRRHARSRSLVATGGRLRVLIQWMVGEARRGFGELDRDAAERFMHYIAGRRRHDGTPIRPGTRHAYANILLALYQQRRKLAYPPSEHPFDKERASAYSGFSRHTVRRLPFTPDAIAVPLISAAIRLIGRPADDVIALRDQAVPFRMDDQGRSFFVHRHAVRTLVSSFRFSTIEGENAPWHLQLTRTAHLRALINQDSRGLLHHHCLPGRREGFGDSYTRCRLHRGAPVRRQDGSLCLCPWADIQDRLHARSPWEVSSRPNLGETRRAMECESAESAMAAPGM